MKRLFTLLALALLMLSCEQMGEYFGKLDNYLENESEYASRVFSADEGYKVITFRIDDAWHTKISADWISVDPASGEAGIVNLAIYVRENRRNESREGWVDIILANGITYRVKIKQLASGEDAGEDVGNEFVSPVPSNQIWYITDSGNTIEPNYSVIDATPISNIYTDEGMGIITFDRDVTLVGDRAFDAIWGVTHIYLPNGLERIGVCAFRDSDELEYVYIPGTVTSIGEGAFSTCSSLKGFGGRYVVDDGCAVIVGDLFVGYANLCGRTEYSIPEGVKRVGWYAFDNIETLKSVTIPESVTEIGDVAFAFCYNLNSVYCKPTVPPTALLDDYVEGWEAFDYNNDYYTIYVPMESVEAYKTAEHWRKYASRIVGYDFGSGEIVEPKQPDISDEVPSNQIWYTTTNGEVLALNDSAKFNVEIVSNRYVDGMGVIEFDGDVTTIGAYSFADCVTLSCVAFPNTITNIGSYAFSGCVNSSAVYISDLAAWCNIDYEISNGTENPLSNAGILYLNGEIVSELTIPDEVTTIKPLTFLGCSSIEYLTIPESVVDIGDYAFYYCWNLAKVAISDGVQTIGYGAFMGCVNMHSAYLGVTTIGGRAFRECGNLKYLTFGEKVKSIGEQAFSYNGLTDIVIPDSVTTIGAYAFFDCENLTSVQLGKGVTTIADSAFRFCNSLKEINLPDGLTTIGEYALADNVVESFVIPGGVERIGLGAFYGCFNLSDVVIADGVKCIGSTAFAYCTALSNVQFGSVETIESGAFYGCSALTSVTLPGSVTTIEYLAFYICSALESVYCEAVTPPAVICDNSGLWAAFNGSGLETIYVPEASVDIYQSAIGWNEYADVIAGYNF